MILRQINDNINLNPINYIQTNSINTVASSAQTTILTLDADTVHNIIKISCSGDVYAKYQLYLNTELIETKNIGSRSVEFSFTTPLQIQNDDILDVKVTHYYSGVTADFDATLYSRI